MTVLKTFGGTFFSPHYGKIGRFIRVIDLLADVGYLAVAQLDRVPGFEPVGWGFESLRMHQKTNPNRKARIFLFDVFHS